MTTGKTIMLSAAVLVAAAGATVTGWYAAGSLSTEKSSSSASRSAERATDSDWGNGDIAFFYQYVGNMRNGTGENATRVGFTKNGTTIYGAGYDVLPFTLGPSVKDTPGDPTYSHLANGDWAVTAWTTPDDPRRGAMLYYEGACPVISTDDFSAIYASSAQGCRAVQTVTSGKTSQIVSSGEDAYVTHMIDGEVYISHVADSARTPGDLEALCVLENPVTALQDLEYGDTQKIVGREDVDGLLMSDTALARRSDGTWVLFVKGIPDDNGCTPNTVCELCQRNIYRTTSSDLLTWSDLERVVDEASVPDAYTDAEGKVWLYWQDFSDVCEAQNQQLSARAPLSAAYELDGSYQLSTPERIEFVDEVFEEDTSLHYATNANPIGLSAQDADALRACF